jgi:serine O-acetyltransferase
MMSGGDQDDAGAAAFVERLAAERRRYRLPAELKECTETLACAILALLFPHFQRTACPGVGDVEHDLERVTSLLTGILTTDLLMPGASARDVVTGFLERLPWLHEALLADARALDAVDPAAESLDEVMLAYPGFYAIACYRIAHALSERGVRIVPRLITEMAHQRTGIDIHPAATIGTGLAIDHGTGVVIGETAVLGNRVKLYQGVTLGALSVDKSLARVKRHPTIEDDVVIYANATILGGETVVGAGSVIGGNVWLTRSVPPRSVVTHEGMQRRQRPDDDETLLEFNI